MVGKIPNMDEMKKLPLSSVIILKSQIHVLPLALCNASLSWPTWYGSKFSQT